MLNTSRKQTLKTAVQTNRNKYSQPRIDRPEANPVSIKISNKRRVFNHDAGTNFQTAQRRKMNQGPHTPHTKCLKIKYAPNVTAKISRTKMSS